MLLLKLFNDGPKKTGAGQIVWIVDPLLTSELVHDPDRTDDEHGKNSFLSFMKDIFAGWRRGHFK